jgi:hypothetical protein
MPIQPTTTIFCPPKCTRGNRHQLQAVHFTGEATKNSRRVEAYVLGSRDDSQLQNRLKQCAYAQYVPLAR